MSSDSQLYEETFTITQTIDKTYDRVARVIGSSADNTTSLTLDVNSELYPLHSQDTFTMLIATTLNLDGTKDDSASGRGWRPGGKEETLAGMWDYVCYGKVYRHVDPGDGGNIQVYVSFGGLLLLLEGPYKKLSPLRQDYIYMLLKK